MPHNPAAGLVAVVDYRCINRDVWQFYTLLYGVKGRPIVRRAPNIDAPEAPSDELASLQVLCMSEGLAVDDTLRLRFCFDCWCSL